LFLANWRLGRSHVLEFLLPCNFVMRALGRAQNATDRYVLGEGAYREMFS